MGSEQREYHYDYEIVHFMVTTKPEFKITVFPITSHLRKRIAEYLRTPEQEEYENLLPLKSAELQNLTTWHQVRPSTQEVIKEFEAIVNRLCNMEFWQTDLAQVVSAICHIATGRVGTPTRILVKIEDTEFIIPWEVLIHSKCQHLGKPPIVYRFVNRSIPCTIRRCIADICPFPEVADGRAEPNTHKHMLSLAKWVIGSTEKPSWLSFRENKQVKKESKDVGKIREPIKKKRLSKKKLISILSNPENRGLYLLFICANTKGTGFIPERRKLFHTDLNSSQSSAAICGLFPVAWRKSIKRYKTWLPFALKAYDWCAQPLLSVTTLFPLAAEEAGYIAFHLRVAAMTVSKPNELATPTTVAEAFHTLLQPLHHPMLPHFLVMAGNFSVPIKAPPHAPISNKELVKSIKNKIGTEEYMNIASLLEASDNSEYACLVRAWNSELLNATIKAETREALEALRGRINERILRICKKLEKEKERAR